MSKQRSITDVKCPSIAVQQNVIVYKGDGSRRWMEDNWAAWGLREGAFRQGMKCRPGGIREAYETGNFCTESRRQLDINSLQRKQSLWLAGGLKPDRSGGHRFPEDTRLRFSGRTQAQIGHSFQYHNLSEKETCLLSGSPSEHAKLCSGSQNSSSFAFSLVSRTSGSVAPCRSECRLASRHPARETDRAQCLG